MKPDRDPVDAIFSYAAHADGGLGITGRNPQAHRDADVTLNLNAKRLRNNRAAAREAVEREVARHFKAGQVPGEESTRARAPGGTALADCAPTSLAGREL